jgi:hypothetical protein
VSRSAKINMGNTKYITKAYFGVEPEPFRWELVIIFTVETWSLHGIRKIKT